jgi:predicted DNA-binding protein
MAKAVTAIRFEQEERSWIQSYADFKGDTFSDVVREAILEKIEDEADILAYREAVSEDDGTRYSWDEVKESLDL